MQVATILAVDNEPGVTVRLSARFQHLTSQYLQHRRDDVMLILNALERGDYESIRILGHNIKGTSGAFGFTEVAALGARLEEAAVGKAPHEMRVSVEALSDYLQRVEIFYG